MKCIFVGCRKEATLHAFSTVGMGDIHACSQCAPRWLALGRYTAFYSPTRQPENTDLRAQTAAVLKPR